MKITPRKIKVAIASTVALVLIAGLVAFVIHIQRRGLGIPAELVPPEWDTFRTSAGHQKHVEEQRIACKECHDYEHGGFKNPGVAPCVKCHAKETGHTHTFDAQTKGDCLTCHAFAPTVAPTCMSCHANAQGTHAAIGVHATAVCTNCHSPHAEPAIVAKNCASCHTELTTLHASHAGSQGCLDCHSGHERAAEASTKCATCHTSPAGPKPANHDSCLSCHKPHDFVAGGEKACIGCHGVKPTLMAAEVTAHAECLSCHKPHDPTQAASSCTTCHANVHASHPIVATSTIGSPSVCTTCHAPHGDPNQIAATCTSCHANVSASDTTAHAGKTACTSCHAPHDFAKPKNEPAFCAGCHVKEQTLASANAGHADCTHCHGTNAHHPAAAPSCATCHAKEQASAPAGHQACTKCHDAHSGVRSPQATCATCHVRESHEQHAVAVGNCATCHRAHGPNGIASPPTCVTCHARPKLLGLHVENGHATCVGCHAPHQPVRSDRATCTTGCHTDKRNHQPQATACSGCHVFR